MTIAPISDLRNYGKLLDKVSENSPVYLTRNGRGVYSIHDIADEERFRKADALLKLLAELDAGVRSGEEIGWYTDNEIEADLRAFSEANA